MPLPTPPPDAARAGEIEPLNPATHPLREEALVAWRNKYAKQSLISDAPPSWFKCFTQGYVAGHDSLAARLARAESALRFYADEGNYVCDERGRVIATAYIDNRLGDKARAALLPSPAAPGTGG